MRIFTDRKWGTKNPIMLRDPEFGPVRLRAFGSFAISVNDPATFLKQIVGTNGRFSVDEIGEQLRDMLVARFADVPGREQDPDPGSGQQLRRAGQVHHQPDRAATSTCSA